MVGEGVDGVGAHRVEQFFGGKELDRDEVDAFADGAGAEEDGVRLGVAEEGLEDGEVAAVGGCVVVGGKAGGGDEGGLVDELSGGDGAADGAVVVEELLRFGWWSRGRFCRGCRLRWRRR